MIVCSGRDSEEERIRTLNLGADDYVVKPFSFAELEARVRAVLRRGSGEPAAKYFHHGDLMVDRDTRTVTVRDEVVPMTRKEFDLLAFLAASPGQVFSREDLLERVWGSTEEWQGRSTVTEHVRRVRLKIEPDPDKPKWITTVRGVGYRFCLPDALSAAPAASHHGSQTFGPNGLWSGSDHVPTLECDRMTADRDEGNVEVGRT